MVCWLQMAPDEVRARVNAPKGERRWQAFKDLQTPPVGLFLGGKSAVPGNHTVGEGNRTSLFKTPLPPNPRQHLLVLKTTLPKSRNELVWG